MTKKYTISKDGPLYYAHKIGFSYIPVGGSFGSKQHATKCAANCMGLTVKDYNSLKQRHAPGCLSRPGLLCVNIKAATDRRKGDIMRIFLELAGIAALVFCFWHEEKFINFEQKIGEKCRKWAAERRRAKQPGLTCNQSRTNSATRRGKETQCIIQY